MNELPIEVFDFHAHLPYRGSSLWGGWGKRFARRFGEAKLRLWAEKNAEAQKAWWRAYGFPFPERPQPPPEQCAAHYAREVETLGLLGMVFVTGGGNETLAGALAPHRKLFGFAHHDPFLPDAAQKLEEAVVQLGLVGYKVFAPALSGSIADPALDPVWETAERLGIPVLIHFGPLAGAMGVAAGENINPLVLHDVAKGFPRLKFIIPHFGCGYTRELLHLMWAADNVYVDTSGNNEWRRYQWPVPTIKDLFQAFYEVFGAERIVFGTDSSHLPRGWVRAYFQEQFRATNELGLAEDEMRAIFSGNALRLLNLKPETLKAGGSLAGAGER